MKFFVFILSCDPFSFALFSSFVYTELLVMPQLKAGEQKASRDHRGAKTNFKIKSKLKIGKPCFGAAV